MSNPSPDVTQATYGQRLLGRRLELGLTQLAVARAVGCTQSQLSMYEHDARRPKPLLAEALDEHLGVVVAEYVPAELLPRPVGTGNGKVRGDREHIRRYQLVQRSLAKRLRPEDPPLDRNQRTQWRRSRWWREGLASGLLPPGPEHGGPLGLDPIPGE